MPHSVISLRPAATADDHAAVRRLAALDSAAAPVGDLVVAEVAGDLLAAISLRVCVVVADPFQDTRDVVRLLRARRAQLVADRPASFRARAILRPLAA